ncbi:hypothetical protein D3C77_705960 [compost metagenome]
MGTAQHNHRLVASDGAGDPADRFLHVTGEVFPDGFLGTEGHKGALLLFALVRHEPVTITGCQRPGGAETKAHRCNQTQAGGR